MSGRGSALGFFLVQDGLASTNTSVLQQSHHLTEKHYIFNLKTIMDAKNYITYSR